MASITASRALAPIGTAGKLFAFGLDVGRNLFKRPFQLREFLQQAWFIASVTIIPTALVAIPFGAVIALQVGGLIKQFGAQSFTGSASVLAVVREAGPIATALLIAGAGGSAIAADLGARKIREELDAMMVLGIDPIQRLVVPRVLACMLVAFFLNGLSFVAVLAALLATRTPGNPDPAGRLGIREGVWGALAYAARTPSTAFTLSLVVVVSVLVLNFNVVVPLVAKDVLNEGAHGFGLLMSSLGAGAVMAGIGLTLLRRGRPSLWFLAASAAVLSAGTASLALVGQFGAAAVLLVALGCCQILFSTGCNTTLQLESPDALRGRVMGLYALANAGMTPFGSVLMGLIAERLGVQVACALGGGSGLVAVIVLVLVARRTGLAWRHPRER